VISKLDEEYVLRQVCRRARGARTRTFTLNARGLGIDARGLLAAALRRLEARAGARIIVRTIYRNKKSKYVVDAEALRRACSSFLS
jgi:hypothetical protein